MTGPDPREVARPFAPPDHSDPAARDTLRPSPALRVGDRAAWVRAGVGWRGRDVEHLGEVAAVDGPDVWLYLDENADRELPPISAPRAEVFPRLGR